MKNKSYSVQMNNNIIIVKEDNKIIHEISVYSLVELLGKDNILALLGVENE